MQRIFTLIITCFILYNLAEQKFFKEFWYNSDHPTEKEISKNEDTQESVQEVSKVDNNNTKDSEILEFEGNFIEKSVSKVVNNLLKTENGRVFIQNFITPAEKIFDQQESIIKLSDFDFIKNYFRINTFEPATGERAVCGHTVQIHYQILSLNNTLIDVGQKSIILGKKIILPGLDSVIVGMTEGQTRHAILAPKYAFLEKKYKTNNIDTEAYYKVNVTLDKIIDNQYVNSNTKIFDDEVVYKMPLVCGDYVNFDAKITKLSNGDVIYDSVTNQKKISMYIGDRDFPIIFSHGLFNKTPIGQRTIISQGTTFRKLHNINASFPDLQISDDEYLMLELKNFSSNNTN